MGFKVKTPQEDPAIAAAREAEAARTRNERIGLLSEQLTDQTRLLRRRYGQQPNLATGGVSSGVNLVSQPSSSAPNGQFFGRVFRSLFNSIGL